MNEIVTASPVVHSAGAEQQGKASPGRNEFTTALGFLLAVACLFSAHASSQATWTPLGPDAVLTPHYGLVSGRVTALAFDPADLTGNRVYVGTTGGGVWKASNAAADPSLVRFIPLTDNVLMADAASHGNLSIGALSVQPGGAGVVLAGTGDPNNVLDSYYGAGILRSTDGGATWSLIRGTSDLQSGLGLQNYSFFGEAFAGFAWSTANPQLVVAAVAQAYEGALVDAVAQGASYQGLYYSNNSEGVGAGAVWHLATIKDGSTVVQGPRNRFVQLDGNTATAVAWNPVRKLFIAAVRFHGYYESADGVTWTRLAHQPGSGLSVAMCPANAGSTGSPACPILRAALAVDPQSGDTFAWTVDRNEQDQGLWQDRCQRSGDTCTNSDFTFDTQWNTAALEANTAEGPATIVNGVYALTPAAVPGQQAMVLAGANDLWQAACPVSQGCAWRNTTNAATCMSARVGLFQHLAAWPDLAWEQAGDAQRTALEQEIFVGNDSGLWRSLDGIAESGAVCDSADASHFQNLNGSLGSLVEVESLSPVFATPYTLMAGLGVNGTAGVKSGSAVSDWPQILDGYGGPVAIDPMDGNNWYVNAQAGVGIYACSTASPCTAADFGASPKVTNGDVGGDGAAMPAPAAFVVDPLDHGQLLVATCRVWRGPATGGWGAANVISPILDSPATPGPCQANALVRTVVARSLSATREVIYVGMYGAATRGGRLGGHVLKAILDSTAGAAPGWTDLTADPVSNDGSGFNAYGMDISSIVIDPHDATGNTVYVTIEGMAEPLEPVQTVYRSTDGGATWNSIRSNLPNSPANALVVDPQVASVVYVATDQGVDYTTQVDTCAGTGVNCWSQLGSGLPLSPVVALQASPADAPSPMLVAGTYGRGIWQAPLWTATSNLTAATVSPSSLAFPAAPVYGTPSDSQTFTIRNTGSADFEIGRIAMNGDSGDFAASGCLGQSVPAGGSCTVSVTFNPQAVGARSAQMILYANVYGGQLEVDLSGTGLPGGEVTVTPSSLDLGTVEVGATSTTPLSLSVTNAGTAPVAVSSITVTAPFLISLNACGATSLPANSACQIQIALNPVQAGQVTGQFTMVDSEGTQTVQLTGTGAAAPTDTLSPTAISFPATAAGQISAIVPVTIANDGDLPLHVHQIAASAGFQQKSDCLGGVAAHTNCTVSVQFAPAQTGTVTGTPDDHR